MIKTVVMIVGLAAFTGASVACFGLFSDGRDRAREGSCEGLSGQAKADCEARSAPKPR
jgi:hypothetical protein